jgi:hypothetical protein
METNLRPATRGSAEIRMEKVKPLGHPSIPNWNLQSPCQGQPGATCQVAASLGVRPPEGLRGHGLFVSEVQMG